MSTSWADMSNWADINDPDEVQKLPPTEEKIISDENIEFPDGNLRVITKEIFEFSQEGSNILKKKTKQRITTKTKKIHKTARDRLDHREPFGDAVNLENQRSITMPVPNPQPIEDPTKEEDQNETTKEIMKGMSSFMEKQAQRKAQRAAALARGESLPEMNMPKDLDLEDDAPTSSLKQNYTFSTGAYVPMALRRERERREGGGEQQRRNEDDEFKSIKISNIPDNTTSEDLKRLFATCGEVARVFLRDKKDYAFVSFKRREDAEEAMRKIQKHTYGNYILDLEWAKRKEHHPDDRPRRTGYGEKLAQHDRTLQYSTASNLTSGTRR